MDVRLPKLGEGVDSGSVVTVFVKVGDAISKGQSLLELENEKAVAPIPSPADGTVTALRVKPGDKLTVGQVILTLAEKGASAGSPPASEAQSAPAAPPSRTEPAEPDTLPAEDDLESELSPVPSAARRAGFPPPAAPSLRRLAKDLGIDLTRVRGSQSGGRIVLADIRNYIQRLQEAAVQKRREPVKASPPEPVDFSKWGPVKATPMSQLRQVISRRMAESWTTIPHVTQLDQADFTAINDLRKKHGPAYEAQGTRLTLTPFVLKAVASTLKKHPIFNASLDEAAQQIVVKEYVHIGIAVDTEAGLLVPVIRDVDAKSMVQLARELEELAEKSRQRKLSLDDMKGGSFTISNQGGIGGAHFTPIINKPEVAILGLGRGTQQPVVRNSQIVPRLLVPLALSYDHRLIDGAHAARFMVDLVGVLEAFSESDVKL